jgi:hypothetical protein
MWLVSFTSLPLYSRGNSPQHTLYRRLDGPPVSAWTLWRREDLLHVPGIEPLLLGRSAHSVVIISTELSRLYCIAVHTVITVLHCWTEDISLVGFMRGLETFTAVHTCWPIFKRISQTKFWNITAYYLYNESRYVTEVESENAHPVFSWVTEALARGKPNHRHVLNATS